MKEKEQRIDQCCSRMKAALDDTALPLNYEPRFRSYHIHLTPPSIAMITIDICPWCGTRLPENLRDQWFDTLEELGIDINDYHDGKVEIPKEFHSEEWWCKRGL